MTPDPFAFGRDERRRRRRNGAVIALLVLGPLGWLVTSEVQLRLARQAARLTAAQTQQLEALINRREELARQAVTRWNRSSQREALLQLKSGDAPCAASPSPPSQFSAGAYVKYGTHDPAFGTWSLCVLRKAAASTACERVWAPAPELVPLHERLSAGEIFSWDLEAALAAAPPEERAGMVVVVDEELPPKVDATKVGRVSFVPGSLSGRAFFYAPAQARFSCAGEVSVRNSKSVDIEFTRFGDEPSAQQAQALEEGRAALERDLEVQLRFAAPGRLRQLE